jgi:hypothetical protein
VDFCHASLLNIDDRVLGSIQIIPNHASEIKDVVSIIPLTGQPFDLGAVIYFVQRHPTYLAEYGVPAAFDVCASLPFLRRKRPQTFQQSFSPAFKILK